LVVPEGVEEAEKAELPLRERVPALDWSETRVGKLQ
jgi:hypothetical protein